MHEGCSYSAIQRGTLNSHIMRKHNRSRKFHCPAEECSYSAVHPGDLRSHVKRCRQILGLTENDQNLSFLQSTDMLPAPADSDMELLPPLELLRPRPTHRDAPEGAAAAKDDGEESSHSSTPTTLGPPTEEVNAVAAMLSEMTAAAMMLKSAAQPVQPVTTATAIAQEIRSHTL